MAEIDWAEMEELRDKLNQSGLSGHHLLAGLIFSPEGLSDEFYERLLDECVNICAGLDGDEKSLTGRIGLGLAEYSYGLRDRQSLADEVEKLMRSCQPGTEEYISAQAALAFLRGE